MSSLIPKISIGRDTKKGNHFDVSSLTHTTSEIGYVQPTFSKELVPNTNVRVSTRSGVRLSPLFVPTMGQIDVRHYHFFVPYSTLWFPFDAFLTQTNYTLPDGTTYKPELVPYFNIKGLFSTIFGNTSFQSGTPLSRMRSDLVCTVYTRSQAGVYTRLTSAQIVTETISIFTESDLPYYPETIVQPDANGVELMHRWGPDHILRDSVRDNVVVDLPIPAYNNCDFSTISYVNGTQYVICYNFSGCLKRVRTIFMGLGYSFNPYDTEKVNLFKLLAFYKAYWFKFGVNRTFNFFNTNCYKLIKNLSDNNVSEITLNGSPVAYALLLNLVGDFCDCTYTCPPDYFNSADVTTYRGEQAVGSNVKGQFEEYDPQGFFVENYSDTTSRPTGAVQNSDGSIATDGSIALSMKIAMRLLRFVNKNSVIGRQISEILRTRYGVTDIHNTTHEDVIEIGANSVPIQISAIYNNTELGDMPLGSYAGLGVGSHRSKSFKYHSDQFGVLITLTAVVPKMGYFQGMLRENSNGVKGSFDFYTPEFDAIGMQSVNYNELVADRQHKLYNNQEVGTDLGIWGYAPFYQHLKVGFNRCLGDISIPHMRDSMLPYTLDRYFPDVTPNLSDSPTPLPLPVNDPQTFRSGTQGNANRIFADMSKTDDHVIMQIFFDVKMTAPMKSISTSYDTWDEDSTQSVDVSHE